MNTNSDDINSWDEDTQLKLILKYQTKTSQAHQSIENRCPSPQIHTKQNSKLNPSTDVLSQKLKIINHKNNQNNINTF